MADLDLDAIKAEWRGFDAGLSVGVDEDGECVIATQDNDDHIIATVHGDYAEQFAELWAGAGPQVAELVAEVERLRAIARGRTKAPTDAEIAAHEKAGGRWRCLVPNALVFCADALHGHAAMCHRDTVAAAGFDSVWWALDRDGCPCAWPEVSRG